MIFSPCHAALIFRKCVFTAQLVVKVSSARPFQLVPAVVVHQLMNIKITQTQIVHNSVCARGYKLPAFGSCRENVTSFPQTPAPPSPGFMLAELVSPEKYINFLDFYFRRASSSRW